MRPPKLLHPGPPFSQRRTGLVEEANWCLTNLKLFEVFGFERDSENGYGTPGPWDPFGSRSLVWNEGEG